MNAGPEVIKGAKKPEVKLSCQYSFKVQNVE